VCRNSEWGEDGAMQDLSILTKIHDMTKYAYPALAQFPKSEKFSLVVDIKHCIDVILERAIEASKKYYKKTTLQEMDVELMKLRHYLRLSNELGFLPLKKYEILSEKVVEIGKMLGGWIKQVNENPPKSDKSK
jgi:four helix bundle protein